MGAMAGHTFFVQQSMTRGECMNVHVTFTEGGVHGKLWRLKEAGEHTLPDEGCNQPEEGVRC